MYTIKKNSIIIEVNKIGKMFEIKRTSNTSQTVTTYSKREQLESKINLLIQPLKEIKKALSI